MSYVNNLSHYQKRIYNKLLPKLGKTEPYEELLRVCLQYRQIKDIKKDNFLFEKFKDFINNPLYFHLKSDEKFYDLDRFKEMRSVNINSYNSGTPMLKIYRKMFQIWEGFGKDYNLSKEQIANVLGD